MYIILMMPMMVITIAIKYNIIVVCSHAAGVWLKVNGVNLNDGKTKRNDKTINKYYFTSNGTAVIWDDGGREEKRRIPSQ